MNIISLPYHQSVYSQPRATEVCSHFDRHKAMELKWHKYRMTQSATFREKYTHSRETLVEFLKRKTLNGDEDG
jgi:hypothetical protein